MSLGRFSAVVAQARLACISEGRRLKTEKRLFWSRPLRSGLPPFVLRDRVPSPFPFFPPSNQFTVPLLSQAWQRATPFPPSPSAPPSSPSPTLVRPSSPLPVEAMLLSTLVTPLTLLLAVAFAPQTHAAQSLKVLTGNAKAAASLQASPRPRVGLFHPADFRATTRLQPSCSPLEPTPSRT